MLNASCVTGNYVIPEAGAVSADSFSVSFYHSQLPRHKYHVWCIRSSATARNTDTAGMDQFLSAKREENGGATWGAIIRMRLCVAVPCNGETCACVVFLYRYTL